MPGNRPGKWKSPVLHRLGGAFNVSAAGTDHGGFAQISIAGVRAA